MGHRPTQKEKTLRAFRAYLDLVDTAEWIRGQLRGQLESFDLTMGGFRLLEMVYREGPVSIVAAAEKRGCQRQNMDVIIARLVERGWVRRTVSTRPPADGRERRPAKAQRGQSSSAGGSGPAGKLGGGQRVGVVSLTPLGKKFIGNVLPRHAKVVKALMRALDGREQESLSRVCRKLRAGDVLRFVSEMTHEEIEDED